MTVQIVSTLVRTGRTLTSGDTLFVGADGTILSDTVPVTVAGGAASASIILQGDVVRAGAAGPAISGDAGAGLSLVLGSGGTLRSSGDGVAVEGTALNLSISGEVTASLSAFDLLGRTVKLAVSGEVTAFGAEAARISGAGHVGATAEISVTGTVAGEGPLRLSDTAALVRNDGTLPGLALDDASLELTNAGRVMGDILARAAASDSVINFGTIAGTVALGGGDDSFDNRGPLAVSGTVMGGDGADRLWGGLGADDLRGGSGADDLCGRFGEDDLWGGAGDDRLRGGLGDDRLAGGQEDDLLHGGAGHDFLAGGTGSDMLIGSAGGDALSGGTGGDTLLGGIGSDDLTGGEGADRLFGGAGADSLAGEAGADHLNGGAGDDVLSGGAGADRFAFYRHSGFDTVEDFERGRDKLDLSAFAFAGFEALEAAGALFARAGGYAVDLDALGGQGTVLVLGDGLAGAMAEDFLF